MADAVDSKSTGGNPVRVRLLPRSPCLHYNTFGVVHLTQGWPEALAHRRSAMRPVAAPAARISELVVTNALWTLRGHSVP